MIELRRAVEKNAEDKFLSFFFFGDDERVSGGCFPIFFFFFFFFGWIDRKDGVGVKRSEIKNARKEY